MTRHNKLHYQSKEKNRPTITLTGNIFLQYADEEEVIMQAAKGDLLVYPNNEALNTNRMGEYEATGFSGYFKVDVSDGKNWQPLIISDIFAAHENHFSKKERPLDTYEICAEKLRELAGKQVTRTYREHYELAE